MSASIEAVELAAAAAAVAQRMGGEDLVAFDVSGPLPFVDVFLLVSGSSERGVVAISREIEDEMVVGGHKVLRREGREEGRWVLLDFGDLVVHVFHQEERSYYGLERLWKDCPAVPLPVETVPVADAAQGA